MEKQQINRVNPYLAIYKSYNFPVSEKSKRQDTENIIRHLGFIYNTFGEITKDFINIVKHKYDDDEDGQKGNNMNLKVNQPVPPINPLSHIEIGQIEIEHSSKQIKPIDNANKGTPNKSPMADLGNQDSNQNNKGKYSSMIIQLDDE